MTTRFATPLATFLVAAGLLGLTSCGGSDSAANTVPADADVVVKAQEGIAWNEKAFDATATDGKVTIYVENDASIAHNMYVLDSNDKVQGDFVDLPTHGSHGTRVLPLAPGTYHIVCKVPGHDNMNSTLTVS